MIANMLVLLLTGGIYYYNNNDNNMAAEAELTVWIWISIDVFLGNHKTIKKTVVKTKGTDVVGHVVSKLWGGGECRVAQLQVATS